MKLEALPSRQACPVLLEAMRAWHDAMHQRFEAMGQRIESVMADLRDHGRHMRETHLPLSALSSRVGCSLEPMVQEMVEACAGQTLPCADRLVLRDEAGAVYGVAGAAGACDLSAHHGLASLVEVTSPLRLGDVLMMYRKVRCAEGRLGRPVTPLLMALRVESRAERSMRQRGIRSRVRATMDR